MTRTDNDDQMNYAASLKALKHKNESLLHHLTIFSTADLAKFDFCCLEALLNHIRIDNRLLGISANSLSFNRPSINNQSNEYVLEISNKPIEKEVSSINNYMLRNLKLFQFINMLFYFSIRLVKLY